MPTFLPFCRGLAACLLLSCFVLCFGLRTAKAGEGEQAEAETEEEREKEKEKGAEEKSEWKDRIWAEEDVIAPDAVKVVVTAERSAQHADDTAAAVGVVDAQRIEDSNPADVTDAMDGVAGVDVQRMSPGGYGSNVSIRGSSDFKPGGFGNRVLVLLDGRVINNPDTHGVDWSALPLFDLSRMEILRGPASALYGSTAVGGVVQLFGRPAQRQADLLMEQCFSGLEGNRRRLAGSLSNRGEDWGFRMSGWWQRYDGLVPAGEDEYRHNSDSERHGTRLVGHLDLDRYHRVEADLSLMHSAGGNPGFEGTSLPSRSRRFERLTLGGRLGHAYNDRAGLRWNTDLSWTRYSAQVEDPDGSNPNAYDTDRLGLRSLASFFLFDRLFNIAGAEIEYQRVIGDVYELGVGSYDLANAALFAQSQLNLGLGFELTGGLRLDAYWYSTHQQYLSFSPKLRLAWRPDKQTVVWMAANRGFRAPSIGELYLRYETSFGLDFQGNPNLSPEVLWAFEVGGRRSFLDGRLSFELVGFWNEGTDTIDFDYRSLPVSAMNLAGSRVLGAELSARVLLFSHLRFWASATFMDARNSADDSRLLYQPLWKTAAALTLFGWWDLSLTFKVQAVGERDYDDFLDAELLDIPRRSLDGYWLADAKLLWQSPWHVAFAVGVRNLFEAEYFIVQDYLPAGRTWTMEARLRFD
ncbi:MAG: TonB-dependent receptor [Deltaproteobacteria bacterium]|nr:TonB-dependent receptor [Deltaproteobacteria bacterium]